MADRRRGTGSGPPRRRLLPDLTTHDGGFEPLPGLAPEDGEFRRPPAVHMRKARGPERGFAMKDYDIAAARVATVDGEG